MKETTANNKAQHPTQDTRATPNNNNNNNKPTKHNNQQCMAIPGGGTIFDPQLVCREAASLAVAALYPQNSHHCLPPFLLLKVEERGKKS
eukprot:11125984-Ditylum_brightwellii.AAC.1